MRVTEIFACGCYGRKDDRYRGDYDSRYGPGTTPPYGDYQRRSLEDRDTPLAKLNGSTL